MRDVDIKVQAVDPRDQDWEKDIDAYRVYFLDSNLSDEYEIQADSVDLVLEWARSEARSREWTLYAVMHDNEMGLGLLRLAHSSQSD